jgi:hypothetical protein
LPGHGDTCPHIPLTPGFDAQAITDALKDGRYTTDAIARRREISGLVRAMKAKAPAS